MHLPHPPRIKHVIIGAAVALAAGLGIAGLLGRGHRGDKAPPPPASQAGLIIDSSQQADSGVDRTKTLRCFVDGKMIGELPLVECAKLNGVATDALDVGIDQTGALAATGRTGALITPLPPAQPVAINATPQQPASPTGPCWRYAEGQWRQLPGDIALNICVQTLFAGHCEKPGGATYGRWSQQTLRLRPGRVEISADNRSFKTLVEQTAGCVVPPLG